MPAAGGSVTRPVTLEELEKMVWSHKENSDGLLLGASSWLELCKWVRFGVLLLYLLCFFFVKLRGVKEKYLSWWLGVDMFQLGSLRIWNSWKELLKMWVVALLLTLLKGSKSEPPTLWEKLIPSVTSIFDTVTGKGSIPNNIFEKKTRKQMFLNFLGQM